jgi:diguanylate cyclase (GGDEF)-like protein/hemerythrin-like metal-binding protein/PAS domain S-box-containing protein
MKSIDIFPWDEHFNTGLDKVDSQHKKLVEILNRLATSVAYESKEKDLSNIFDELIEYTIYHFKTEEAIWDKYFLQDSMNKEHHEVHQQFVDTVLRLKSEQNKKPLAELADEALGFLAKWLASHILDTDRHMSYIVFAIQDGNTIEDSKVIANEKMNGSSRLLIDIILSIYSTLSSNTLNLMRELKIHNNFNKKVSYQEKYKHLLLELSASFINIPLNKIDTAIQNSLESMATFVGADRAYIFEYNLEAKTTSNTYEWCAKNISSEIDNLQNISTSILLEWQELHNKGEYILVDDVKDLTNKELRNFLISQKIQSLVTIPLMEKNICKGFVGFETVNLKHKFAKTEIELLEYFTQLLANINNRRQIELELLHEKSFLKTLIQTIPDLVWLKDSDGLYLACNTRFEEFFGAKEEDILGKNDYDFVNKDLADIFRINDNKVMKNSKAYINEEEVSFAIDGHKEILQTTKVPMYNNNGELIGVLGVARDITERIKISNALKNEQKMLEAILDNAPIGIWMSTSDGKIKFVNKTFCELTGIDEYKFISANHYSELFPADISNNCQKTDNECISLNSGVSSSVEVLPFADGENHTLEVTKVKLDDVDNETSVIGLAVDITQRQQQEQHLEYIAHYDALTGLPNRLLLSDRIHQALAQTNRHKQSLTVAYLDLDGFKAINDTYGHDKGDKLLTLLAERMRHTLRDGDTIARLGGDEFVIVLLDLKNHEDCVPMLKRLLNACSQEVIIDTIEMHVSASLGVAFFDAGDETDADQLLRQADQAMYQAKLSGKNRYYIFDAQKDKKIRTYHESLDEIQKALQNEEFVLYYQPKVNMQSGEIVGAEALIRWNHPTHGLLSPEVFLPVMQGHSLSVKVGDWVFNSVMQQIQEFKEKGVNLPISINVDAMQLQESDFVQRLKNLLKKYPKVKPTDFTLEVLETSALEDIVHISHIIESCQEIGILFSLDDFGTGYSSLTYLKRLPAKELKIDRSFVSGMLDDPDDLAILDGILGLSSAFRREVIAEGVTSIEHGEMLLQLGCKIAQGYVIARPMPHEDILTWIKKYKVDERWKKVTPISRDDLPLLYAHVEHNAWTKKVLAYLRGMRSNPPKLNHKECRFGEWLYKDGVQRYAGDSTFEELERLHNLLHEVTNIAIDRYKKQNLKEVEASIEEIKKLSNKMLDAFKNFKSSK